MPSLEQNIRLFDIEFKFNFHSDLPLELVLNEKKLSADSSLLELSVQSEDRKTFHLSQVSISWEIPATDMQGVYMCGNPKEELSYLPYWQFEKASCANRGVPFLAFIDKHQQAMFALGLLDQLTETRFQIHLSEITRCYHCDIQKPHSDAFLRQTEWSESIYVSKTKRAWPDVLTSYRELVDRELSLMPVPDSAYDPVFCSWTAIHHDVSHDWIMRNARLAAELGFKTWLTDDGWFLKEGKFGNYRLVGDWEPEASKFPDFKQHVKDVQDLGFKYILWVAPFMIGDDNQRSHKYEHMLTTGQEREAFKNLSPKHPDTRHYVFNLLNRLVKSYDLDGLKIDFLDSIPPNGKAVEGELELSFGAAFFNTLKEAIDALRQEKPDLLIEFRNNYTNLASRTYGNLYRSSDVPINPARNRWQAVMLRLLAPDRAVHLDPALWHPEETDENVALHLIQCLVSVPTVSIELDTYPESHLELLRNWIGFYNDHKHILIHGKFKPVLRQGYIPAVYFEGEETSIIAVYDELNVVLPATRQIWILNASNQTGIFLKSASDRRYEVTERNMFGEIINEYEQTLTELSVVIGGSLELKQLVS